MDDRHFDDLAGRVAARLSRRRGLGLLAGASLPLLGVAEMTHAKKKKKKTLCNRGQTVTVPKAKAKKLLRKGATKGACATCPTGQKACNGGCIATTACCNCTPPKVCSNGTCLPELPRCGNGGPCVVFASSGILGTEIGGVAEADQFCQTQASQNVALSGRIFKAWISVDESFPVNRFTNIDNAGPYELVSNSGDAGAPPRIADNFQDLTRCDQDDPKACIKNPINRNALGDSGGVTLFVWTGTATNGGLAADNCDGWTSGGGQGTVGRADSTDANWTDAQSQTCFLSLNSVYCFEQAT